jgi:hypothetical protein
MTHISVNIRVSSMAQNVFSCSGTLHNRRVAGMLSHIHFCLDYATQHLAMYTGQLQRQYSIFHVYTVYFKDLISWQGLKQ